jgi:hypothetical protein
MSVREWCDNTQFAHKGGATTLRNLQVAHAVCNIRKGARTDWRLT